MDFRQEFLQLLNDKLPRENAARAVEVPDAFNSSHYSSAKEQHRALRTLSAKRLGNIDQLELRIRIEKLVVAFAKRCIEHLEATAAESMEADDPTGGGEDSDTDTICGETASLRDYLRDATIEQQMVPQQSQAAVSPSSSRQMQADYAEYVPLADVQQRKQSGRRKKPPVLAPRPVNVGGNAGANTKIVKDKISVDACFSVYNEPPAPPPALGLATLALQATGDAKAGAGIDDSEPLYDELLRSLVADPPDAPDCPPSETAGKRLELVQGVLKEETFHLNILKVLQQYARALNTRLHKRELIQELFFRLDELHDVQAQFVNTLAARLSEWTDRSSVGDLYLSLLQRDVVFEYARHLDKSKGAMAKLESTPDFRDMFKTHLKTNIDCSPEKFMISVANNGGSGGMEEINVSDAIAMPAKWLVTHSENCKLLMSLTPEDHGDRKSLQEFCDHLRQAFEDLSSSGRRLLKQQMLVELVGNSLKLRRLFLFSDTLICAKQKLTSNGEFDLLLKWFVPKNAFVLYEQKKMPPDFENKRKETVNALKAKIKQVQSDIAKLKSEAASAAVKGGGGPDMRNLFKTSASRKLDQRFDRLKKLQGQLIVSVPSLPMRVGRIQEKQYTLLLSSELEKREWETTLSETLLQNCQKFNAPRPVAVTVAEVTELLAAHRYVARGVTDLGYHYLKKSSSPAESEDDMDNEGLIGTLKVVIHKIDGLAPVGSYGVAIELNDLSHHFCRIHATQFIEHKPGDIEKELTFEKEFQIQLDGTESSIRFVVTRLDDKRSVNIGHLDLRLYSASLKDYFAKCHYLTQADRSSALLLTLSLDFVPSLCSLTREATAGTQLGIFGTPLDKLIDKAAGVTVPKIVSCLTKGIERQIEELGIYRISGSTLELQEIRGTIDANVDLAASVLNSADVHLLTGLLKLFFRELPEPLLTCQLYQPLMQTMDIKEDKEKDAKFAELTGQLPDANRATLTHLFDHLLRVDQHSGANKMSLANMGIIFGPTLICPPISTLPDSVKVSGLHTIRQGGILVRMLNLHKQGRLLASSSAAPAAAAQPSRGSQVVTTRI